MRNLFLFFIVCFFSCNPFLEAHDESERTSIEELLFSCSGSMEIKNGESNFNPDRIWDFNGQIYVLNNSEQWILAGNNLPNSVDDFIKDHAKRGVCFKGHQGEYLDRSHYEDGIWCCRGIYNGKKCPYHIDNQFPNGIPGGGGLICLANDFYSGQDKKTTFFDLSFHNFP